MIKIFRMRFEKEITRKIEHEMEIPLIKNTIDDYLINVLYISFLTIAVVIYYNLFGTSLLTANTIISSQVLAKTTIIKSYILAILVMMILLNYTGIIPFFNRKKEFAKNYFRGNIIIEMGFIESFVIFTLLFLFWCVLTKIGHHISQNIIMLVVIIAGANIFYTSIKMHGADNSDSKLFDLRSWCNSFFIVAIIIIWRVFQTPQ
ncbi:MAG: hypothetical protein HQK49_20835 [Oligoflexia bacterium]|nr:hypothetical protein [Oligoflexia bacterium]